MKRGGKERRRGREEGRESTAAESWVGKFGQRWRISFITLIFNLRNIKEKRRERKRDKERKKKRIKRLILIHKSRKKIRIKTKI